MNERMYYSHEAEVRARQERTMVALVVMMMGLGIGAALALLFAPRSGEEVRKELGKTVDHAYNDGQKATNHAIDGLRKEVDRLRSDVEDRLKDVVKR